MKICKAIKNIIKYTKIGDDYLKINIKILVSIVIVLIWMVVIYKFSAMSSNESNSKSKEFISQIAEKIDCDKDTTSKIKKIITKKKL